MPPLCNPNATGNAVCDLAQKCYETLIITILGGGLTLFVGEWERLALLCYKVSGFGKQLNNVK